MSWTHCIVDDAKNQLLRRFCLIDAIARLAFKLQVIYTGKVFVPKVPEQTEAETEIRLWWKEKNEDETQSSNTSKLSDILEDQLFCTITVSAAPVSLSDF